MFSEPNLMLKPYGAPRPLISPQFSNTQLNMSAYVTSSSSGDHQMIGPLGIN